MIYPPKGIPAADASTGEQKALLIGLVLAHAGLLGEMTGFAPVLLLDEVVAHLDPARRSALYDALARLESGGPTGVQHLVTETMRPSRKGRRYRNNDGDITVTDGPFTETKELIAGYAIVSAGSLDEAGRWARRYLLTVGASEGDVRELE